MKWEYGVIYEVDYSWVTNYYYGYYHGSDCKTLVTVKGTIDTRYIRFNYLKKRHPVIQDKTGWNNIESKDQYVRRIGPIDKYPEYFI